MAIKLASGFRNHWSLSQGMVCRPAHHPIVEEEQVVRAIAPKTPPPNLILTAPQSSVVAKAPQKASSWIGAERPAAARNSAQAPLAERINPRRQSKRC